MDKKKRIQIYVLDAKKIDNWFSKYIIWHIWNKV